MRARLADGRELEVDEIDVRVGGRRVLRRSHVEWARLADEEATVEVRERGFVASMTRIRFAERADAEAFAALVDATHRDHFLVIDRRRRDNAHAALAMCGVFTGYFWLLVFRLVGGSADPSAGIWCLVAGMMFLGLGLILISLSRRRLALARDGASVDDRLVLYGDVIMNVAGEHDLTQRVLDRLTVRTDPVNFARIAARIAAIRAAPAHQDQAVFSPAGRTPFAYIEAMRSLAARQQDFRSDGVDPAAMWRTVENPLVPPTLRAGAAIAIASSQKDAHERLRIVAHTSASPHLRVAIEAACDADEERLQEAVRKLAEEGR